MLTSADTKCPYWDHRSSRRTTSSTLRQREPWLLRPIPPSASAPGRMHLLCYNKALTLWNLVLQPCAGLYFCSFGGATSMYASGAVDVTLDGDNNKFTQWAGRDAEWRVGEGSKFICRKLILTSP